MYTIHPFRTGALPGIVKGEIFTYLVDSDVEITIPMVSFLITADHPGDDTVILVDTGITTEYAEMAGRTPQGGGPDPFVDELDRHGLAPEDVDTVILSHLHYDHACNNALFPNAEIIVQRKELEACRDPLPHMERPYLDEIADELDELNTTVIDGGFRLREGIDLVPTPGHTRGQQTTIVKTAAGPHAVVSDLAYCRHNLDPGASTMLDADGEVAVTPTDMEYIPPGLHVDTEDCYESYARVRDRIGDDGVMIGGHDAEVVGKTFPE